MENRLEQRQEQILSQKMIQSVEILQMGSAVLTEYLKSLSMENPVIDIEEFHPEDKKKERLKKAEWLANLDHQNRAYYRYERDDGSDGNLDNIWDRKTETLGDHLRMQLISGTYSDRDMEIFDFIIQCLDSRGFYIDGIDELVSEFEISREQADQYLTIMRDLEPAGVCAGSLRECLLKQLEKKGALYDVERVIVEKYLELLGKNQLPVIARTLKISLERVKKAQERIQSLNPIPARGYHDSEILQYIVPDITVVKFQDYFEILLNDYTYPVLRINQDYLDMIDSDCAKEVKEYLNDKVKEARQVQDHLARRSSTLIKLARCILEAQKDFFLYGENHIKAFSRRDAAICMDVHESTVSRAIKDKYLQCCWGNYPLSYFFSRRFDQPMEEGAVAVEQIKQQLIRIINEEDKKAPYSDEKLADILKAKGIRISRRTVTKYREAMGIANGRKRKEF